MSSYRILALLSGLMLCIAMDKRIETYSLWSMTGTSQLSLLLDLVEDMENTDGWEMTDWDDTRRTRSLLEVVDG